jgi:hypothetical protein
VPPYLCTISAMLFEKLPDSERLGKLSKLPDARRKNKGLALTKWVCATNPGG